MTPFARRAWLTAHVVFSVGWLGAVVAYLPCAVAALTSADFDTVQWAFFAMERIGWWAIVPLCLASFLSGVVQSLGTEWGLVRHYWIVTKLVLTLISTAILLAHMPVVSRVATAIANTGLPGLAPEVIRAQFVVHAAGGLVLLVAITALSIFKPWGRIGFGRF